MVIEIGPGIGTMTQEIAKHVYKVIAVEIDNNLIPILKNTLKEYSNIEIINKDFLKLDLKSIINKNNYRIKIIANLPYYIATNIIINILQYKNIDSLTIMVQKEVADRINAKPKTKSYGSLSLFIQYYATTYYVANVPRNCFIPRPKINSSIIHLKIKKEIYNIYNINEELLFKIIKGSFAQRRKRLLNCIFNMKEFDFTKDELKNIISLCGFNENIRAEELNLEDFINLTREIKKIKAEI